MEGLETRIHRAQNHKLPRESRLATHVKTLRNSHTLDPAVGCENSSRIRTKIWPRNVHHDAVGKKTTRKT